jgi:phosphonopyruvate decarboxylase
MAAEGAERPARSDVARALLDALAKVTQRATLFATTGFASRTLYALRKERGEDPALDFLNVGAMGHVSSVAAGFALAKPERTAVVLDGDGAVLMHMGALATTGAMKARNLVHVVLDNEAHESVGGAGTASSHTSLDAVAKACGYASVARVDSVAGFADALAKAMGDASARPAFLLVKTKRASTEADARPDKPLPERHAQFLTYVRG